VREGEQAPKKGWFSRNKSQTPNPSISTSHSPSPAGQTQKLEQQSTDDSDLPPREAIAPDPPTSTPHTSGTGHQPSDVVDDVASELPSRAGFDLAAMRAVIEGIEGGTQKQQDVNGIEIAPPPPHRDTATTPPQSPSPPIANSPGPISARAAALGDMREDRPFRSEDAAEDANEDDTSRTSSPASTFTSHSRSMATPTVSFNGDGGASWTPPVPDKDIFGSFGSFGGPVGNPFRSTQFAAMGSTVSPSNVPNASLAASAPEREPWSFQTFSGDVSANASVKKSSVFAANPWES
jgi:hypothetical protein